jgi:predicted acetyltransferase
MAELHARAYPDSGQTLAERTEALRGGVRVMLSDRILAFRDGELCAQLALLKLSTRLGKKDVPAGGIGGVAVAPTARRSGVARALLTHALETTRDEVGPLSLLYPFREDFYAELGWGRVAHIHRLVVPPAALPAYPERMQCRPSGVEDIDDLASIHDTFCERTPLSVRRKRGYLEKLIGDPSTAVVRVPGEGYLLYQYRLPPQPSTTQGTLVVQELVHNTDRALRALIGFLAVQGDQIHLVQVDLPAGHPLPHVVVSTRPLPHQADFDLLDSQGTFRTGMMARVVDVRAALSARGGYGDGQMVVRVEDKLLPDNRRPLVLKTKARTVNVEEAQGASAAALPSMWVTPSAFAKIYTGALRPSDAARLGLARFVGERADAIADSIFRYDPPFPIETF